MTNQLNLFFSALSDATRRSIVERLSSGPATVSALAAPFDIALPTLMRHLKVLEDSGLVQSTKKGRVRTCYLETSSLIEAQGWLAWQQHISETHLAQRDQLPLELDD